jgi:hypothetical protein
MTPKRVMSMTSATTLFWPFGALAEREARACRKMICLSCCKVASTTLASPHWSSIRESILSPPDMPSDCGKTRRTRTCIFLRQLCWLKETVNERWLVSGAGAFRSTVWDVQNRHLTNTTMESSGGRDVFDSIPVQHSNFIAYSSPSGSHRL